MPNTRRTRDPAQRFWSKVDRTPRPEGCWLWNGGKSGGYGVFYLGTDSEGKQILVRAHRYAWELTHGQLDDDTHVLPNCGNKDCVRPEHLYIPNSPYEAIQRARERGDEIQPTHSGHTPRADRYIGQPVVHSEHVTVRMSKEDREFLAKVCEHTQDPSESALIRRCIGLVGSVFLCMESEDVRYDKLHQSLGALSDKLVAQRGQWVAEQAARDAWAAAHKPVVSRDTAAQALELIKTVEVARQEWAKNYPGTPYPTAIEHYTVGAPAKLVHEISRGRASAADLPRIPAPAPLPIFPVPMPQPMPQPPQPRVTTPPAPLVFPEPANPPSPDSHLSQPPQPPQSLSGPVAPRMPLSMMPQPARAAPEVELDDAQAPSLFAPEEELTEPLDADDGPQLYNLTRAERKEMIVASLIEKLSRPGEPYSREMAEREADAVLDSGVVSGASDKVPGADEMWERTQQEQLAIDRQRLRNK